MSKINYIKLYKPTVNLMGTDRRLLVPFLLMCKEYHSLTGNVVQVNSAVRTGDGSSIHDWGFAIDIQTIDANRMEELGLLEKYGLHRPLLYWRIKETWHIELYPGIYYGDRNANNVQIRRRLYGRES